MTDFSREKLIEIWQRAAPGTPPPEIFDTLRYPTVGEPPRADARPADPRERRRGDATFAVPRGLRRGDACGAPDQCRAERCETRGAGSCRKSERRRTAALCVGLISLFGVAASV